MLNRIARRLGFEQSVPVNVIEGWALPEPAQSFIELAPRLGTAACLVDEFARVQPVDASWSLELTLAAGARWIPLSQSERLEQKMVAPGVVETIVQSPAGPIATRIAAGVVGGEPVAIVEVENTGGVAIAVGAVVRPLRLAGRGHIGEVDVNQQGLVVDGARAIRFEIAPASVAAVEGSAGDLIEMLPDAGDVQIVGSAKCRSGGAQAAAVWPLPHTATARLVIELANTTEVTASVPSADDINRGWNAHLGQGLRVAIDEVEVDDRVALAARSVLTLWPEAADTPGAISALSELGFGRDAGRFFEGLERTDDDAAIVRSLARWAQLGEMSHQLEDLERVLGPLARAAHGVDSAGRGLVGPAWLDDALVVLGGRLHQIGQPDVAERIQSFEVSVQPLVGAADREAELARKLDKRGVWPEAPMSSAAEYVRAVRAVLAQDVGPELQVLPDMPTRWRGRAIDVFGLPIANGNMSFGLRWHGPRPALLWEATLAPEAPFAISAPGIDADFRSTDRQGEVLLADPGWTKG